jgi:hypothetical protein
VHVFEEDTAEGEVYRPESGDIPLTRRPRARLAFAPDGTARVLRPGPDDRPLEVKARWEETPEGDLIVQAEGGDEQARRALRVVERSPGRLVLKK